MEIDLQKFLTEMRREQREDTAALEKKLDVGFGVVAKRAEHLERLVADHTLDDAKAAAALEVRLRAMEHLSKDATWLLRTVVASLIVFLFDLLFNHLPHWRG